MHYYPTLNLLNLLDIKEFFLEHILSIGLQDRLTW